MYHTRPVNVLDSERTLLRSIRQEMLAALAAFIVKRRIQTALITYSTPPYLVCVSHVGLRIGAVSAITFLNSFGRAASSI